MTTINIDPNNGAIVLPSGYFVSPALTQDKFKKSKQFSNAQTQDYGTFPWIHYSFSGGAISERDVLVSVCFYEQTLIYTTICVNLYPPGSEDWSSYSLDVETATKNFHDSILEKILGEPTEAVLLPNMNLAAVHESLAKPFTWTFKWGKVLSAHDFKGGGTYIKINYGNRNEEATRAYQKRTSEMV